MGKEDARLILIAHAICSLKPTQCDQCPMYSIDDDNRDVFDCNRMLDNIIDAIRVFVPNYEM